MSSSLRHTRNITAQIEQNEIGKDLDVPEPGPSIAELEVPEKILDNSMLNTTQHYVRKQTPA